SLLRIGRFGKLVPHANFAQFQIDFVENRPIFQQSVVDADLFNSLAIAIELDLVGVDNHPVADGGGDEESRQIGSDSFGTERGGPEAVARGEPRFDGKDIPGSIDLRLGRIYELRLNCDSLNAEKDAGANELTARVRVLLPHRAERKIAAAGCGG